MKDTFHEVQGSRFMYELTETVTQDQHKLRPKQTNKTHEGGEAGTKFLTFGGWWERVSFP